MDAGRLSLIILGHNKSAVTAMCLRSLLQVMYRPLEIVFVNNGCTDRTQPVLEAYRMHAQAAKIDLEVMTYPTNGGCIVPRNEAMARCRGQWVALLDNDTILRSRGIFERLVGFLAANRSVGAVAPKFVYPAAPYRIQSAGGGVTREGQCYLIGRGADRDAVEFASTRAVPWVLSACMVMSRELTRRVGPLDQVYHPVGFEDVDYCFRIRAAGQEVVYVADTELYHIENTSTFGTATLRYDLVTRRNQRVFRRRWKHMFPAEPAMADLPAAHVPQPRVPLWDIRGLPVL